MPPTSGELALHEALHDLTDGQPAQPADRIAGVRRRHVRRRTRQTVGAALAAGAVAAGAVLAAGGIGHRTAEPIDHDKSSWMLPWPARYGQVTDAAATQSAALDYYARFHAFPVRDPHPLYVGTPARSSVEWVVVEGTTGGRTETGGPAVHQLIALASPDGGVSWTPYVSPAPAPSTPVIGFAWDTGKAGHTVLMLAAPDVRLGGVWRLLDGPSVPYGHSYRLVDGVRQVQVRHRLVPGASFVSGLEAGSAFSTLFPEGTPGLGRLRPWQRSLDSAPAGERHLAFIAGTGGGDTATVRVPRNGTATVTIRCVGPGPVRVTLEVANDGVPETVATQTQCNGAITAAHGEETLLLHRGDRLMVTPQADELTSFAVGVYLVS